MLRLVLVPVVVTRLALFVALILDLERLLDEVFLTALTLTEVTAFETTFNVSTYFSATKQK
jgi:hypothetical protein